MNHRIILTETTVHQEEVLNGTTSGVTFEIQGPADEDIVGVYTNPATEGRTSWSAVWLRNQDFRSQNSDGIGILFGEVNISRAGEGFRVDIDYDHSDWVGRRRTASGSFLGDLLPARPGGRPLPEEAVFAQPNVWEYTERSLDFNHAYIVDRGADATYLYLSKEELTITEDSIGGGAEVLMIKFRGDGSIRSGIYNTGETNRAPVPDYLGRQHQFYLLYCGVALDPSVEGFEPAGTHYIQSTVSLLYEEGQLRLAISGGNNEERIISGVYEGPVSYHYRTR